MIVPDNRDDDVRPTNADASPSVQRPVTIGGSGAGIGDVMHNMRQQMDSLFSSLFAPNPGFFNPNRQFFPRPFFPSVPADSSGEDTKEFLDFGKLPPNYKNSTSETKVVDGKVIEVNKTVHKISGDNSNGFFQFSVIKIRPSEDTPAAEEDKQQPEATVIEEKKPDEALKLKLPLSRHSKSLK
ncbi:Icarapin-like [Orchesella cincta]|uniref:Icarapin-like n=1 Tax=Orchesella cincta TaxID=48709 RepID=A0A1D2M4T8_ORCCI|nr:Icarapin-like [Orchesella cincta]